ncbi:HD-GYP domain-containing protein [Pelagibacterium sp. H642]|uniref:HD-GYP domain-containing protein n=1 Tax=Pelagibacterium sp. H642 TaxID=1881069 RepID=UPI0028165774|nr:HD-GYP domain-containing protein [Pelagibacterium sp. H642]WMT92914.1 HD-GYP domain-containing protein [Pelagibacterium sp. H642]
MLDDIRAGTLGGCVVVWDLDLSRSRSCETARMKMDAVEHELQSIFLVSGRSALENVQAWAFGARVLITRHRAPAELPAQLGQLVAAAVTAALKLTVATLDNAFSALALNKPISHPQILRSASFLVDAVNDVGISGWLDQAWEIDELTSQHCVMVAGVVAGYALHLGLPSRDVLDLTCAAILHDIGKAKVPLSILNKPGKLNDEERAIIESHPRTGWNCLRRQGFGDSRVLDAILHHHEYLDGSGYPDGLCGDEVTDFARIITLCDIFSALLERRPYKPPRDPDVALEIMRAMHGKIDQDLFREFSRFVSLTFPRQSREIAAV